MATCPVCKSVDAYYGIFGWNCISCSNPKKESEPITTNKYDGGEHWTILFNKRGLARPDWADLLNEEKIHFNVKCAICNCSWGEHFASNGQCMYKGKNNDVITYYKHPAE